MLAIYRLCSFFVLVAICAFSVSAQITAPTGAQASLGNEARFSPGGDKAWAAPDFDDSGWSKVTFPHSWNRSDVAWNTFEGAYRIRFDYPSSTNLKEPTFFAYLLRENEVWINGVRVGSTSNFGRRLLEPSIGTGNGRAAAYRIPSGVLKAGEENVVTVFVNRLPFFEPGGILAPPLAIVEYSEALDTVRAARTIHHLFDGIMGGMNLILCILAIACWWAGLREWLVLSFGLFMFGMVGLEIIDSHWMRDNDLKTPFWDAAGWSVFAITISLGIEFYASLLGRGVGWLGRIFQLSVFIGAAPIVMVNVLGFIPTPSQLAPIRNFHLIMVMFGFLGSLFWVLALCVSGIRKGKAIASWLLLVFGSSFVLPVFLAGLIPWVSEQLPFVFGDSLFGLTKQIFFVLLAGLIGLRLTSMERERFAANQRALIAQSEERERVARDLHDGVGQWLNSHKIRLQLLREQNLADAQGSSDDLSTLVEDVDTIIADTSRIARDLSPSSVERRGLEGALRDHAITLAADHGLETDLDVEMAAEMPNEIADHVYRIVQEASNNAIKHGHADRMTIRLLNDAEGHGELVISDNGVGFNQNAVSDRQGLGLQSIHERAAIMNGECSITSTDGSGVVITIRF